MFKEIVKILENKGMYLYIILFYIFKNFFKNMCYYSFLSFLEFSFLMKFCVCVISVVG